MREKSRKRVPAKQQVHIECVRCGQSKAANEFLANKWSSVYVAKKRVPICKTCVQELFNEYSDKYGVEMATFLICAVLDMPFDVAQLDKETDRKPPLSFGKYYRRLQMKQYNDRTFAGSVTDGGQKCPKVHGTNDRLLVLQEDVSALREELHNLTAHLTKSQNKLDCTHKISVSVTLPTRIIP